MKAGAIMGFTECDDAMGSGMFFSLPDDGDTATLKLMGEPEPREGSFKNKPRTQYVFPVVSEDGLQLWTVGARLYRRLRDGYKKYKAGALKVTRHGKKDSQQTTYDLQPCKLHKKLAGYVKDVSLREVAEIMKPPADVPAQPKDDIPF